MSTHGGDHDCEKEMLSPAPIPTNLQGVYQGGWHSLKEGFLQCWRGSKTKRHRLMVTPPALHSGWFRETFWQRQGPIRLPGFSGVCERTPGETLVWSKGLTLHRHVCGSVTGNSQWPEQGHSCAVTGIAKSERGGVRSGGIKATTGAPTALLFQRQDKPWGESAGLLAAPHFALGDLFPLCCHPL